MPETTDLHTRILEIIETEWLRPYDPDDHAGDTPGARAYDAARYIDEAVQDEMDRRSAAMDARISALAKGRDGLLFTLQQVQGILDRRVRPYSGAHAHNCMHAVAEIQRLLNPWEETPVA